MAWGSEIPRLDRREEGQAKGKPLVAGEEDEGREHSMIDQVLGALGCVLTLYWPASTRAQGKGVIRQAGTLQSQGSLE